MQTSTKIVSACPSSASPFVAYSTEAHARKASPESSAPSAQKSLGSAAELLPYGVNTPPLTLGLSSRQRRQVSHVSGSQLSLQAKVRYHRTYCGELIQRTITHLATEALFRQG